jgi:hypothetical protein
MEVSWRYALAGDPNAAQAGCAGALPIFRLMPFSKSPSSQNGQLHAAVPCTVLWCTLMLAPRPRAQIGPALGGRRAHKPIRSLPRSPLPITKEIAPGTPHREQGELD